MLVKEEKRKEHKSNKIQRNIPIENLHKVAPIWTASNQPVRAGDLTSSTACLHKSVDISPDLCPINYLYLGLSRLL